MRHELTDQADGSADVGAAFPLNDRVRRLPGAAALKLLRLREEQQDVGTILRDLGEQQFRAGQHKTEADRYLGLLRETSGSIGSGRAVASAYIGGRSGTGPGSMPMHTPDRQALKAQIADAERELTVATAQLNRINARIEEVRARQSRLPAAIIDWLGSVPNNVPIELYVDTDKPDTKTTSISDLERIRDRIADARAEIGRVRAAPPPAAEVKRSMREQIAALAERGRPNYLPAVEAGHQIKLPEITIQAQVATANGIGVGYHQTADVYGFLCWLFGDAIAKRMETDIDELADDDAALTADQKAERERALRADMLEFERAEERIIEQLGSGVSRRDDADPRAVLCLSGDLPAPIK